MDLSVFLISAGIFAAGLYIGRRSKAPALNSLANTVDRKTSAANEANDRYLEVLRRELANIIARDDPYKMIALYGKAKVHEGEMLRADKPRVRAELTALTHEYPVYADFDKIGTKHFVPYSADDELPQTYLDISKFLSLTRILGEHSHHPAFSDDDDQIFQRCMQELKDRKLRRSLEDAVDKYYVARQVAEESGSVLHNYEDRNIGIFHLPSYTDVRYGIHLKQTNEYGVYSYFVHDDGKISSHYGRSDKSFESDRALYR
jgi:hypothetical protein